MSFEHFIDMGTKLGALVFIWGFILACIIVLVALVIFIISSANSIEPAEKPEQNQDKSEV